MRSGGDIDRKSSRSSAEGRRAGGGGPGECREEKGDLIPERANSEVLDRYDRGTNDCTKLFVKNKACDS